MNTVPSPDETPAPASRRRRRWWRGCALGCGGIALFLVAMIVGIFVFVGSGVPKDYPLVAEPIPPPGKDANLGGGLDGFSSPYVGHTGSWDGKGGAMAGASKLGDLEKEEAMGLRWTFMPVYWRAMEPDGPVNLSRGDIPPAWQALDAFVVSAQARKLNVLMQAPVVGGNAGGPPKWAGRREEGKSAPTDMEALAAFAGKLVERYRPGGTLAEQHGWGDAYGVRAWELDNEPESYFTHWKGQAGDYAEFATRAAAKLKAADPQAVILLPGMAAGKHGLDWLRNALDAPAMVGSPAYKKQKRAYSIGPVADVVSFHNYEGLDSAFTDGDRTITHVFSDVRAIFEQWETQAPGFTYPRKQEYWHTEGSFDFIGALSAERRAAWRFQLFTRAFAAGIRKVVVMDATPEEQIAVKAYVAALPDPFPMLHATDAVRIESGQAIAFRHPDDDGAESGQVWIVWAIVGSGDAFAEIPVRNSEVRMVSVEGRDEIVRAENGHVRIHLRGDEKMAPAVLIIDRAM